MNNYRTRIKKRITSGLSPRIGYVLVDKHAEAQTRIAAKELEFLSSQSSIMIANALNSIALPKKKSWLKRILGI